MQGGRQRSPCRSLPRCAERLGPRRHPGGSWPAAERCSDSSKKHLRPGRRVMHRFGFTAQRRQRLRVWVCRARVLRLGQPELGPNGHSGHLDLDDWRRGRCSRCRADPSNRLRTSNIGLVAKKLGRVTVHRPNLSSERPFSGRIPADRDSGRLEAASPVDILSELPQAHGTLSLLVLETRPRATS